MSFKKIDYTFFYGKYKDLESKIDIKGFETKLNAFFNLLSMRPGTLQDTPECGIDFNDVLFSEGEEISIIKNRIRSEIIGQTIKYVSPDLIQEVMIEEKFVDKTGTGEKMIDFNIVFTNEMIMSLTGKVSKNKFDIQDVLLNEKPFLNNKGVM